MFLAEPPQTATVTAIYDEERASDGYVGNNTRAWCYRPDVMQGYVDLRARLVNDSTLTEREIAILVTAMAGALADSYCSLAWGARLARLAGEGVAAAVISDAAPVEGLDPREAALARWARTVTRDPNATTAEQVDELRAVGLTDREIFEATTFVAFRVAFSTVDSALGAQPDHQLAAAAPPAVRVAVSFGRPPAASPSL
jgi:uncharacterized peroxidase-related enzyme